MENLEKIRTEYMLKETGIIPTSRETVLGAIDVYIDDLNEASSSLRGAIRENNVDKFFAPIANFFKECFGYDGIAPVYFDEDTSILNRHVELVRNFRALFYRMQIGVTDDNFIDMYKLVEFTSDKYLSNYNYLEQARDGLRFAYDGVNYCCSQFEDDKDEFFQFFEEEFKGITSSKSVEKVKK